MHDIDVVILWVDGSDPVWAEKMARYKGDLSFKFRKEEFRDWELLKFWFRGIEKFMPWVRKIHFVTDGQVPEWLNLENEKIHWVDHKDIMPAEILPVFNSSVIESYINRIEGLAEHFIYFNDDFFVTKDIKPDFFFKNGLPCDMLAFQPVVANESNPSMTYIFMNDSLALARHFKKYENIKMQPFKYYKIGYPFKYFIYNILELAFPRFTGFYTAHSPSPYLKSVFDEVWEAEADTFEKMKTSRFRSTCDVNQYLFREWQKLTGRFYPVNVHRGFRYVETNYGIDKICGYISGQKQKILCLNDSIITDDFDEAKGKLHKAFESIMPDKCSFEK